MPFLGREVPMENCINGSASSFTFLSDFENRTDAKIGTEVAVFIILFISAIGGNINMLVAILRSGSLLNTTHILLTNLVVAGLLFSMSIPIIIVTRIATEWKFGNKLCKVFSFNQSLTGMCSILTMTSISYDRYMCIVNVGKHRLTKTTLILMVISIWTITALFSLPVAVFQTTLSAFKTERTCHSINNQSSTDDTEECHLSCRSIEYCGIIWRSGFDGATYLLIAGVIFYILPPLSFCIFYTKIFLIVRKSSRRIAHHRCANEQAGSPPNADARKNSECFRSSNRQQIRLAKMSAAIIASFILMWMPYFIVGTVGGSYVYVNTMTYFIANLFAHANVSVNPFIYGYFNPAFREQHRLLLLTLVKFIGAIKTRLWPRCTMKDAATDRSESREDRREIISGSEQNVHSLVRIEHATETEESM